MVEKIVLSLQQQSLSWARNLRGKLSIFYKFGNLDHELMYGCIVYALVSLFSPSYSVVFSVLLSGWFTIALLYPRRQGCSFVPYTRSSQEVQ